MKKIIYFSFFMLYINGLFGMNDLLYYIAERIVIHINHRRDPVINKFFQTVHNKSVFGATIKGLLNKKSLYKILGINAGLFILNVTPYYIFKKNYGNNFRIFLNGMDKQNAFREMKKKLEKIFIDKQASLYEVAEKINDNEELQKKCDEFAVNAIVGCTPLQYYREDTAVLEKALLDNIKKYNENATEVYNQNSSTFQAKNINLEALLFTQDEIKIIKDSIKKFQEIVSPNFNEGQIPQQSSFVSKNLKTVLINQALQNLFLLGIGFSITSDANLESSKMSLFKLAENPMSF